MFERVCWIVLAIIHVPPFVAYFTPTMITRLYAIPAGDPSFLLIHHRAALFGMVVVACIWATLDPNVRRLTTVLVALSMLSFLAVYGLYGQPESLKMIAIADIIGLPFLAYVAWKAFGS